MPIFSASIQLAGAVALLIWGLYMVKSGILRTFGEQLRAFLSERLKNRFEGFAAGIGLAALLQSSTATALLIAGLQNKGLVTTAIALACVLGADLGSALVVRILSLDLSALIPVLVFGGVVLFIRRPETRFGQFGRILLGLAFIMMALQMIVAGTAPIRESDLLREAFQTVNAEPIFAAGIGAALAIVCFSSLAVVCLAAAVAGAGVMTISAGLWVVLGANLGSAVLAVLSTVGSSAIVRRAPWGNALFRAGGFVLGAGALAACPWMSEVFSGSSDALVAFHLGYNAVVGVIGLSFIRPVAKLVDRLLPSNEVFPSTEVQLLKRENLLSAGTGLVLAAQELEQTLMFCRKLWAQSAALLPANPPVGQILERFDESRMIRRRCRAVERYLDVLLRRGVTAAESAGWQRVSAVNDGLAAIADAMNLMLKAVSEKKCAQNCFFTKEGLAELQAEHAQTAQELALLASLVRDLADQASSDWPTSEHVELKRRLLAQIEERGRQTFDLVAKHMARVKAGRSGAIETSALHVELVLLNRRLEAAMANMAQYL